MRAGSRSSANRKLGLSHISAHTRAVKPITMRISPGMPRKPKRRSSLSSHVIGTHGKGTCVLFKVIGNDPCWGSTGSLPSTNIVCRLQTIADWMSARVDTSISRRLAWQVTEAAPRKTPLYDGHVRLGAKMVPFAGWLMPVQYTSIVEEHRAVRNNVGIFDISHMGQLIVEGAGAREWLNTMLTNNVEKLDVGIGQYTFLLNDRGGIIDDLIVYRIEERKYLLVVNAARADEDFAWLQDHLTEGIYLTSRSADFGAVAIQGSQTTALFHALFGKDVKLPARNHIVDVSFNGTSVSVARTGYTGEDGIEVFFAAQDAVNFWDAVLERGKSLGIKPCGLGARDTLRLEMCYPLNGSDLSPE